MKKRIIISGGGTAGHIMPLISVYKKIKDDFEVLYLGSGPDRKIVEAAGIKYKRIFSGKWRRYFSFYNFIDPFKVLFGFLQTFFIILFFRPKIVFTKGGYVTVPVGLAAKVLFKRLVIHESDVIMGLSNRILAPFAKKIFTAFPVEYYSPKIKRKAVWTGLPVREEILTGDAKKAVDDLDFKNNLPTVLFIGGSSGARGINKLVLQSLDQLLKFCQVVHIVGPDDYEKVRSVALKLEPDKASRFRYFDFLGPELSDVYAASDLVVSRSGATTLAELAGLGKPSIIIPYPFASADHQNANAKVLYKNQAAILYEEKELTPEKLVAQIKRLIENQNAAIHLSENIKKFYKKESANIIAQELTNLS